MTDKAAYRRYTDLEQSIIDAADHPWDDVPYKPLTLEVLNRVIAEADLLRKQFSESSHLEGVSLSAREYREVKKKALAASEKVVPSGR